MADREVLNEPQKTITAGDHIIEGVAKCNLNGTFNGQRGDSQWVSVSAVPVHFFSPTAASRTGVVTIFDTDQPRLGMGNVIVQKRLGADTVLCSVSLQLANPPNVVISAQSADLSHRRLGHINNNSLDVLKKVDSNGVDYVHRLRDGGM